MVDETIDPATQHIILKIVKFLKLLRQDRAAIAEFYRLRHEWWAESAIGN